jgi:hypothetical protein
MGKTHGNYTKFWPGNLNGRDHFEDLGVHRIILEWTLNRVGGCGLNLSGSELGPVVGSCEHGIDSLGSVKDRIS